MTSSLEIAETNQVTAARIRTIRDRAINAIELANKHIIVGLVYTGTTTNNNKINTIYALQVE